MKIQLPEKVKQIIETLQKNGHEAYAVGGCVRDSLLGRVPGDWDITTSALPEETKALFERTFDTGIEHGTITVLLDKEGFEVTTYRIDGKYEDSRHPKEVTFTRCLAEDLLRRDFTINAMAYNDEDGIVDLFEGMKDLSDGVIRCVGDAMARFGEDALRIMRAVRFAAQLGFSIEEATRQAIRELAPNLRQISAERIQVELIKLLSSPHPEKIRLAYELGITGVMLPEFDALIQMEQKSPYYECNAGEHVISAMREIEADKVLRLTMLFHEMGMSGEESGEAVAKKILHRLKFDNDTLKKVTRLVRYHDYQMEATDRNVRFAIHEIGEDLFPLYLKVRRADILAQSSQWQEAQLQILDKIEALYAEVVTKQQCVSLKTLAVKGGDLIKAGVEPGPQIGKVLEELLEVVLEDPECNQKEVLLDKVKNEYLN